MSRVAVDELLLIMDQAYDQNPQHSLLTNLSVVSNEAWLWLPPGSERSIRHMVAHIAACKFRYDNQTFGDRTVTWGSPAIPRRPSASGQAIPWFTQDELQSGPLGLPDEPSRPTIMAWLAEGHRILRGHVAALDDEGLKRPGYFMASGQTRDIRWSVQVMVQHDLYHAGEINHINALYRGTDVFRGGNRRLPQQA
jgi:hypothetical protein